MRATILTSVVAGLLATYPASAAYVQQQACDSPGRQTHTLAADSVRANLTSVGEGSQRLAWELGFLLDTEEECELLAGNVSVTLSLATLFDETRREVATVASCSRLAQPMQEQEESYRLRVRMEETVDRFYPLASFHCEMRVSFVRNDTRLCLQANITPALGETASELFRWLPVGIFAFVFVVGILRTWYDKPIRLSDGLDGYDDEQEDARRGRAVLPQVGDCLHYLQFIFLTGALSVRYPGFFQPVVGNLNWFSLLLTGPVTHGFLYPSALDGIYETNGTFGGTFGLDLMHQIVGAPNTMATWLNMAISIGIIAVVAALTLEGYQVFFPQRDDASEVSMEGSSWSHLKFRLNRVLRFVLSYFTLPIVSISFYQFDNAGSLPGYHTTLAILLIVCIIAAFFWLIYQVPVRSLGMLVFDSKRYQYMSTLSTKDRYGNVFIMILFVLSFIRGVAIGGLQISPVAQLAILSSCEIILLVCISGFQAYPARSIGTISSLLRFFTLCLMVVFLPGLGAGLNTKSITGYVILLMHAIMLFFGFFLPAVYHGCLLAARSWSAPQAEAYGLRTLRPRGTTSSMDILRYSEGPHSPSPSSLYTHHRPTRSVRVVSSDSIPAEAQLKPNHFFRPPRPTSALSVKSAEERQSRHVRSTTSLRTAGSASSSGRSTRSRPRASLGAIVEPADDVSSTTRSSASIRSASPSLGSPTASNGSTGRDSQGRPLGPRWHDYSFREADLYYMAGQAGQQEGEETIEEEEPADRTTGWQSIRKVSSSLWSKVATITSPAPVEERGFQVIRPNRPPPPPQQPRQQQQGARITPQMP